ncbi:MULTISPECIES: hypothetical protein [Symbiopectobacterium]|uniref:hypothetical protein n=1 Tax=Symbiopectobacterium TaxID=801 RepID=UPI002079DC58|nr:MULTISPECIES: hypothetical protein [Symbiopectobacterium]MBT9429041.1 hypothetical protein [Candidatus Symbiopectobacterium endolongispinus]
MPVIKIGKVKKNDVYAMINHEKDEVFGRYYRLNDGVLYLMKKFHDNRNDIILDGVVYNATEKNVIKHDYCELKLHRELGFTNDFEKYHYSSESCAWPAPISYLKEKNASYYNVILSSIINLRDLSDIALNILSDIKDDRLIDFYKKNAGIAIDHNDCIFIKNSMIKVRNKIHYYHKHFELLFKLSRDYNDSNLAYFIKARNIVFMPQLFDYKYPGFTYVILHEIFHSIGMGDYFYHLVIDRGYQDGISMIDYVNIVTERVSNRFTLYKNCSPGGNFYAKQGYP